MSRYQSRYRVESTRLPEWDYSSSGAYFITICTKYHIPLFGEIIDSVVHLTPIGEIAAQEWVRTPQVRSNIILDEWVIMPNHIHGIIIIQESNVETPRRGVSTVSNRNSPQPNDYWKPNTLGSIINQYKSICTKRIHAANYLEFAWQSRFYDHIIRDEKSLEKIREYIRNNPMTWELDQEHPSNHKPSL